jgi:hypothetical protein
VESRNGDAGRVLVDLTAIKKPGESPAFKSPCLSRRLLIRAPAMFGLFYFPILLRSCNTVASRSLRS